MMKEDRIFLILFLVSIIICVIGISYHMNNINNILDDMHISYIEQENLRLDKINVFDSTMTSGAQIVKTYKNEEEFSESNEHAQRSGYQIIQVSRKSSIFNNPDIIVVYQKR